MRRCSGRKASKFGFPMKALASLLPVVVVLLDSVEGEETVAFYDGWQRDFTRFTSGSTSATSRGPPEEGSDRIPMKITNGCDSTIWPGIATQAGTGPGTGGFELGSGRTSQLWVSSDWQGRVWGRTNCTVNGDSCACETGDCFGKLNCEFSVSFNKTHALQVSDHS